MADRELAQSTVVERRGIGHAGKLARKGCR